MMHGMQDEGIMACGKHFPGHGDTNMDSHISLPTIKHDINRLDNVEMYPFKHAINENISTIMTAHLLVSELEEEKLPATMSKKILTGLLREKLGFEGIIMTDCLEMDAISKYYGVGKGALMSLLAGSDIVLISHTAKYQIEAFNTIKQAIEDGSFPEELLDKKVERILEYKKRFNLVSLIEKIKSIPKDILNKNNEFSQNIITKALTLVKDNKELLPIMNDEKVFIVSPIRKVNSIADDVLPLCDFGKELAKKIGCGYESFEDVKELYDDKYRKLILNCKNADKVVVGTYNAYRDEGQQKLLRDIVKVNKNVILVALRIPYDASLQENDISTAICSYEYTDNSVKELCDSLPRSKTYNGKLPVCID
jgi:beta-N-acetylhexosaminidase